MKQVKKVIKKSDHHPNKYIKSNKSQSGFNDNNIRIFPNTIEVDDSFPYKQNCNVYSTSQCTYDLNLQVDKKYYKLQLLKTTSQPFIYYSWFRWGQVGSNGSNMLFGPENEPSNCIEQFNRSAGQVFQMLSGDNDPNIGDFELQIGNNNNYDNPIADPVYNNFCNVNPQNENYTPNLQHSLAFVGGGLHKSKNFFYSSKHNDFLQRKFNERCQKRNMRNNDMLIN